MRIAITGSRGQLGTALARVYAHETLLPIDLPEHDITDLDAITAALRAFAPDLIIHAAAMTNVDACETDPDLAYRVNTLGTRNVAVAALQTGAPMVYVSTDYVFAGDRTEPYWEFDEVRPLSVYGHSKWAGEQIVRQLLSPHYIVRTAWLYGDGPRNFVETVLRLARERGALTMVTDEVGSPTYAPDLAGAIRSSAIRRTARTTLNEHLLPLRVGGRILRQQALAMPRGTIWNISARRGAQARIAARDGADSIALRPWLTGRVHGHKAPGRSLARPLARPGAASIARQGCVQAVQQGKVPSTVHDSRVSYHTN